MIKITNAQKYFNRNKQNEIHVINNISLELPDTGMIAIFGKSGCGKTTLLNTIGGLDDISAGNIEVCNENITRDSDYVRNKYIGYIFQNYNLNISETVFENVANALRLCGMTDENEISMRVIAALTNVGMEKFKFRTPDTLSGGQQQRVAIARALVKNPSVILADEPTGNLDETNTLLVMNLLKEISKDHLVVLVTHEENLVDFYCDRVIELSDGSVKSIKENENANGVSQRSKNDIYLGELECNKIETNGVSLEYYGDVIEQIHLKIVSIGGKLYLQSDSPKLKILDSSSEIMLKEGVYVDPRMDNDEKSQSSIDMTNLGPIEGKKFGKLFDLKKSIALAWKHNYSKKMKMGNRLLRLCLIFMAIILVFTAASSGVSIRDYNDIKNSNNQNVFFIPYDGTIDLTPVSTCIEQGGTNGIDNAYIISGHYAYFESDVRFKPGNFMTANILPIRARTSVFDVELAKGLKLLAGTDKFDNPYDVMITSAVADSVIEDCGVSYINEYDDIIGMVSSDRTINNNYIRVIGIVESNEKNMYLQSLYAADMVLYDAYSSYYQFFVKPESFDTRYEGKLNRGEVAYISDGTWNITEGQSVTVLGKNFTVTEVKNIGYVKYNDYVEKTHNVKLSDFSTYYSKLRPNENKDKLYQRSRWYFEHYSLYLHEYYSYLINECATYFVEDFYIWYAGTFDSIFSLCMICDYQDSSMDPSMDPSMDFLMDSLTYYAAYKYKEETGDYPTEEKYAEADILRYINEYNDFIDNVKNKDTLNQFYDYQDAYQYMRNTAYYVMNDDDYITLTYAVGESDESVMPYNNIYDSWHTGNGTEHNYSHYMMIHTSDNETAAQYLSEYYSDDFLITSEEIFNENLQEKLVEIIAKGVAILVVALLMSLCVYLIMRSSLMNKVKEVGIYRAIGVSKKNLTFRFFIETLMITTTTVFVGFILSSVFIVWLSRNSLMESVLYFPLWLAGLLLAFIYAVCIICGIAPLRTMLIKTPSEIIAKYDI